MRTGAFLALVLAVGCSDAETEPASGGPPDAAASAADPAPVGPAAIPAPPKAPFDPNPLGLPPMTVELSDHKRVFAFSDKMMTGAREGSTLVLYAATALGVEEGAVVIEGREGETYRVHPGYVIVVPEKKPLRIHDAIVTEWAGVLQHAVVTRFGKAGGVVVEILGGQRETVERTIKDARVIRQEDGLSPGNFAIYNDAGTYRHLLLVSTFSVDAKKRWLALGYGGAATLVDEAALSAIPVKFKAREGDAVWAEWLGKMRPASVIGVVAPASYVLQLDRAGQPARRGWGFVTAPLGAPP